MTHHHSAVAQHNVYVVPTCVPFLPAVCKVLTLNYLIHNHNLQGELRHWYQATSLSSPVLWLAWYQGTGTMLESLVPG